MILESDVLNGALPDSGAHIRIPSGLVGLPEATDFELVWTDESLPIMWLRSTGPNRISLPVVQPGPLVPAYRIELGEADDAFLSSVSEKPDPLVLTVLTVKSVQPQKATVNLVGPIVIDRQKLIGRQVILANSENYSVEHPVIDETQA
jgi:flagellar assembly factor FliW